MLSVASLLTFQFGALQYTLIPFFDNIVNLQSYNTSKITLYRGDTSISLQSAILDTSSSPILMFHSQVDMHAFLTDKSTLAEPLQVSIEDGAWTFAQRTRNITGLFNVVYTCKFEYTTKLPSIEQLVCFTCTLIDRAL
jgi:hypothetical protein